MSKTTEMSRIPSEESCETEQDFISGLPDGTISHILSLLNLKDAVRTSVLSKFWEYKWTSIPEYEFFDDNFGLKNPSVKPNFVSFVERTLLLSNKLQCFGLRCDGEYNLQPWITDALSRKLRILFIDSMTTSFVLSRELLTCHSLRELHLDCVHCTLKVHEKVCFPNLTVMVLCICISNEHSNSDRVEFNCPLLEELDLMHCKWLNTKFVEIYAPKMIDLKLMHPVDAPDACSVKIIGDNLVNLNWFDVFAVDHVGLSHVLSGSAHAVNASMCYYFGRDEDMVEIVGRDNIFLQMSGFQLRKLLKGFSNLKDLEIGGDGAEVIAKSKLGLSFPMYYKMERLVLTGLIYSEALLELLHATPYLKILGISVLSLKNYDYEAEESIPSCIVSHLKKVMIVQFRGKTREINLIKFFLNQASQLKSLSVMLHSKKSEEERRVIAEKLSTYPKASTCLKLTVVEWNSHWCEFAF